MSAVTVDAAASTPPSTAIAVCTRASIAGRDRPGRGRCRPIRRRPRRSRTPASMSPVATRAGGPIAVNGGSAATITASTSATTSRSATDVIIGSHDARVAAARGHRGRRLRSRSDFDPVAYLPKALALAHKLAPDARAHGARARSGVPDGRVDLTMAGRDREYKFRSPARSAHPPRSRRTGGRSPCMSTSRSARDRSPPRCGSPSLVRRAPRRCTALHSRACGSRRTAAGAARGCRGARSARLFDEKWSFDTDSGDGKGMLSRCRTAAPSVSTFKPCGKNARR